MAHQSFKNAAVHRKQHPYSDFQEPRSKENKEQHMHIDLRLHHQQHHIAAKSINMTPSSSENKITDILINSNSTCIAGTVAAKLVPPFFNRSDASKHPGMLQLLAPRHASANLSSNSIKLLQYLSHNN